MLELTVHSGEMYNEATQEFIDLPDTVLLLEHSLISISKWESKTCKPFLTKEAKTYDELILYVKCMTLNKNVNPDVYTFLRKEDILKINEYIESPMTATTITNHDKGRAPNRKIITSEVVYNWMIQLEIPFDPCEKWHFNRLMTLIQVCNAEQNPGKKMNKREAMAQNKALNAQRRARANSHG